MLSFSEFILESRVGAAANANGVRHELLTAGVLNHMSKHYSGSDDPNLFKMNDKELKDHFDKHVTNGKFSTNHMPEHFRDNEGQTPKQVHDKYTHESLSPEDHFKHFRNAVHHAKQLHDHLSERGYDPKTISHVAWTSVDGNVNSYMKKHGNNPNRVMNKTTDDADLMANIKHKDGTTHPIGLSLKWGSKKGATPTAKNNTHRTVLSGNDFVSPHVKKAIEDYHNKSNAAVEEHSNLVKSIYPKKSKEAYDADVKEGSYESKSRTNAVDDSFRKKSNAVASHLEHALHTINNGENGHNEIKNFVRSKLQIPNPDFVAARSHMTVDKNDNINGNHFEDHSTSLNDHLNNAHKFHIERNGATISVHALDKDGKKLFTHRMWTKNNSRNTDKITKWLHAVSVKH